MADGTVFIDTRMDTSGFDSGSENMEKSMDKTSAKIQKTLSNAEKSAKSKAASIAAIYRKQGLSQQEAFKKAWEEIERDTKKGSKKTNKHIKGIGTQSKKTSKNMVSSFSGAISKLGVMIGGVFAVGKLIQFGKESVDLGSDLQEVQNVVDVTFTTMNEKVNEFAQNAAETAGLSETMAKRYTGTFGAMAKAFGFAENEAFDMSTSLTQLSGDVASFYNLSQDEAYTKLKSVFTGETESLKDLGVVMTQTALDSFAMAKGYGKTTSQMSEQEKVALRYAFVLDQLSAASGDFVRTQDSWANQTRILSLNFDSFKANIGQALVNIFTPFLKVINQIVDKMAQLSQRFVAFSEMLAGKSTSSGGGSPGDALAGIESGYEDITNATEEAEKAQNSYLSGLDEIKTFQTPKDATNTTGSVSGLGSISPAETEKVNESLEETESLIDRMINKLIELVKNKDWGGLGSYIAEGFNGLVEKIDWASLAVTLSNGIKGLLDIGINFVETTDWRALGNKLAEFIANIDWSGIAERLFEGLGAQLGALAAFMLGLIEDAWNAVVEWWHDVAFEDGEFTIAGLLEGIWEGIKNIGNWLMEHVVDPFINGFKEAFGIHSPSTVMAEFGEYIVEGLKNGIDGLIGILKKPINGIIDMINGLVSGVVEGINMIIRSLNNFDFDIPDWVPFIGGENVGFNISEITPPKIPLLATGAVIPPNAPFMAMLGDQKHGNNLEMPEDLLRKVVREESGGGRGGSYTFQGVINRRVLFEEFIEEAKLRQSTSGRNPFELA